MSAYVTRKNAVVAALEAELDISPIHASELANLWEFEANRRGLSQTRPGFWELGHDFMVRQVVPARRTPSPGQ